MRLLSAVPRALELERLRILDLYLLFPPLLHRASMPQAMKAKFRAIGILQPDEVFGRLPSTASAYQELRLYQTVAASYLAAKEILRNDLLHKGIALFDSRNVPEDLQAELKQRNAEQMTLVRFLLDEISQIPLTGNESIYRRAGLPSRHLVS
jgi:hypothetical protein